MGVFQVVEGPKEETAASESRLKIRAMTDKAHGWVSEECLQPWSKNYKCIVSTSLHDSRAVGEDVKILRDLAKGEALEFIDGPYEEGKDLRVKIRAKKDGLVGWATLVDVEKGSRRLD